MFFGRRPHNESVTRISVGGFKSIAKEQSIDIRPLTILAGANSSGKSSMMQPLLLAKQTLAAEADPGVFLLYGPNVKFTEGPQLLTKSSGKSPIASRFTFGVWTDKSNAVRVTYQYESRGFAIQEMVYELPGQRFVLHEGDSHKAIAAELPRWLRSLPGRLSRKAKWSVERNRCFLSAAITEPHSRARGMRLAPYGPPVDSISTLIHLPGLRGNPERTYPVRAVGPNFPGVFHEYVASLILRWQHEKSEELARLANDLDLLRLTWKVVATPIDDTQVELRVGRLGHGARGGAQDLVSIADVGVGVSQTLPVLVALRAARPGQLVYIEQPEIHLHPRAQVDLAAILADAAKRGVRVVAETHSALLLLGIQTLVAKGDLDPSLVALHWFERDKDGCTKVSSRDLDEKGAFGDWPEDFDTTELKAGNDYLDAVEARESGHE
ncbi:MAG: AAA family ATPase [Chloroflexi bacterium]|nr:AAA family ATPase [Chloroflexota bacterium]